MFRHNILNFTGLFFFCFWPLTLNASEWLTPIYTYVNESPSLESVSFSPIATEDSDGSFDIDWQGDFELYVVELLVNESWEMIYTGSVKSTTLEALAEGVYQIRIKGCNSGQQECSDYQLSENIEIVYRPTANNDDVDVIENRTLEVNLIDNDVDPESLSITINALNTQPIYGTASILSDGKSIIYQNTSSTCDSTHGFTDSLQYTAINSATKVSDIATLTLNISCESTPIGVEDVADYMYNTAVSIPVLQNDYDTRDFALHIEDIAIQPEHGEIEVLGDIITYTPASDSCVDDSFSYTLSNTIDILSAPVQVTLQCISPIAVDDYYVMDLGRTLDLNFVQNDINPLDTELTINGVTSIPHYGTYSLLTDKSGIEYYNHTNACDESGYFTDYFTYQSNNGTDRSINANVEVRINCESFPVANADSPEYALNTPLYVPLIANDYEPKGLALTEIKLIRQPEAGTLQINGLESLYIPANDYCGGDSFSYILVNSNGRESSPAEVSLSCTEDLPIAVDDYAEVTSGETITIDVLANDFDPTGGTLEFGGLAAIPHYAENFKAVDNTLEYTAELDLVCNQDGYIFDTLQYRNSRWITSSKIATITVKITCLTHPVAQNDSAVYTYNEPLGILALTNDSDPNNLSISISEVTKQPIAGLVTWSGDSFTYTPEPDSCVDDSFEYVVTNTSGYVSQSASVSLVCQKVAPIAVNDNVVYTPNEPLAISALSNDSDPNNLSINISEVTKQPTAGLVTWLGDTFTYTPDIDSCVEDAFEYTIANTSWYVSQSASVLLACQNIIPIAIDDYVIMGIGETVQIDLLSNDSDPQGLNFSVPGFTSATYGSKQAPEEGFDIAYRNTSGSCGEGSFFEDSFQYRIVNSNGISSENANVFIKVVCITQPDDKEVNYSNNALNITIPILDNEQTNLTFNAITSEPTYGDINVVDNVATYIPNTATCNDDSFTYNVKDENGIVSDNVRIELTCNSQITWSTTEAVVGQSVELSWLLPESVSCVETNTDMALSDEGQQENRFYEIGTKQFLFTCTHALEQTSYDLEYYLNIQKLAAPKALGQE